MRLVVRSWGDNCSLAQLSYRTAKYAGATYRAQYHDDALLTATTSLLATSTFYLCCIILSTPGASIMAPRDNQGNGGDEPKPEKSIATLSTLR